MPDSLRAGMATSARQVVGLQDPPKNTSTGADVGSPGFFLSLFFWQSSTLLKDFVLRSSFPGKLLQFVVVAVVVDEFLLVLLVVVVVSCFSFVLCSFVSLSVTSTPALLSCRELNKWGLSQ